MISNSSLPLSLWSEALKTILYVLNRVPIKVVPKTSFEVWKVGNLNYNMCTNRVVPLKLQKKLDRKIVSGFFIGYAERSMRYRFYYLSHNYEIIKVKMHVC